MGNRYILVNKNVENLSYKEFLKLKNSNELWSNVNDGIFEKIYKEYHGRMDKIAFFVFLLEESGIIETNIQEIFKDDETEYITYEFLLSSLLENMGDDLFKKNNFKDQKYWMMTVLAYEFSVVFDKYNFRSHLGKLKCNILKKEKFEIENTYNMFIFYKDKLKEEDPTKYEDKIQEINAVEQLYKKYKTKGFHLFKESKNFTKKNISNYNDSEEFEKQEKKQSNLKNSSPKKIGGILYLVAFGLILNVFRYPYSVFNSLKSLLEIDISLVYEYYGPITASFVLIEPLIFSFLSILTFILLYNMYKYRRKTIILLKIYFISSVVGNGYYFLIYNMIDAKYDEVSLATSTIIGVAYAIYVFNSKRVKETFVN